MTDKKRLVINCDVCDTRKMKESVYTCYDQIIVNADTIIVNEESRELLNQLPIIMNNDQILELSENSIFLDSSFVMDKYFPIRAKADREYFVAEEVILKDNTVNIQKLIQKNIVFKTKRLVLPEAKVEECAEVFDEKTEFVVVPEGMELIAESIEINREILEKYGSKLFVYGNARFNDEEMNSCDAFEKIVVKGKVILQKNQMEAFKKMNVEYDELEIVCEAEIRNLLSLKVDNLMLENLEEGIEVQNVVKVEIAEDVEPDKILKYLKFRNCARIICSNEQYDAVSEVSKNIAYIGECSNENYFGTSTMQRASIINSDYFEM